MYVDHWLENIPSEKSLGISTDILFDKDPLSNSLRMAFLIYLK